LEKLAILVRRVGMLAFFWKQFYGLLERAHLGATCPQISAAGILSSSGFGVGSSAERLSAFSLLCWCIQILDMGWWMERSFAFIAMGKV
jgi:hypothetical protein